MNEHPLTGALLSYANETLDQLIRGASPAEQRANRAGWRAIWQRVPADDNIVLIIASAAQREKQFPGSAWLLPIIVEQLELHFAEGKQFRRYAEILKRVYRLRAAQSMEMAERLLYSLAILRSLSRVEHPVRATLDAAAAEIERRLPQVQPDQRGQLSVQYANALFDIEEAFKST
jgi:hypothetical protein